MFGLIIMRNLLLSILLFFASYSVLWGAQDEGYFLSFKQKGQLISSGLIQDDEGVWYNIRICPGYMPPYRYAKKYLYKTGSDFEEYFHAKKYNDLAENSKDAYKWAFDDCIYKFIIKDIPKAWGSNFQSASNRTKKRVLGWWFAYPWAFMESTIESAVRIPVGLTGAVLGTGWGTAVVPTYYMTNSAIKGVWHLSANTIAIPVISGTWNTVVAPPLSLIGQKPSLQRVDGFWVKPLTNEQVLDMEASDSPINGDDIVVLEQWALILSDELKTYEQEYEQVRNESADAIKKIRENQHEKEIAIAERELMHVDRLRMDPNRQQTINTLREHGFTAERLKILRNDIREEFQENRTIEAEHIDHALDLLIKYPPSLSSEKGFITNKTDPIRTSVDIIDHLETPREK